MVDYRIIVDSCLDFDDDLFAKNGEFFRIPFGINIDDQNIGKPELDSGNCGKDRRKHRLHIRKNQCRRC